MPNVIKATTWNVNSLRIRLGAVTEFLDTYQPDILCLQETKVEDTLFPQQIFTERGYHLAFHGQKSYNGVAIASKTELTDITTGFGHNNLPEELITQTRLIAATTAGLRIVSAYVTNGESVTSPKFTLKEAFYANLTACVANQLETNPNLIICGDFNVATDDRDIYKPERAAKEVLFTPQEREWLTHLLTTNNLTDSFRHLDQTPNVYSWYNYITYARNPANGARIDYLFTSPALTLRIHAVHHHRDFRDKPQPSDHIPVTLELQI